MNKTVNFTTRHGYKKMNKEEKTAATHAFLNLLTGQTVFDGVDESLKMEYNYEQMHKQDKNMEVVEKNLNKPGVRERVNEDIRRAAAEMEAEGMTVEDLVKGEDIDNDGN